MSTILLEGKPVAEALYDKAMKTAKALEAQGVNPVVALVRVGENPADISYENSIKKNFIVCMHFVYCDGKIWLQKTGKCGIISRYV